MNKIIKIIALFAILTGRIYCEVTINEAADWESLGNPIEILDDDCDYDKGDRFTLDLGNNTIVYGVIISSEEVQLHIYDYDGNEITVTTLDADWTSGTTNTYTDIGSNQMCLTRTSNEGEFFVAMQGKISSGVFSLIGGFFNSDGTQSRGQTTEMDIAVADSDFQNGYKEIDCAYSNGWIYILGEAKKLDNAFVPFYQAIDVSGDTSTAPTTVSVEGIMLLDDTIDFNAISAIPNDGGAVAIMSLDSDYSFVAYKFEDGDVGSQVSVDQNSVNYDSDDYFYEMFGQPVPGTTYVSYLVQDDDDSDKMFIITIDTSDMSTVCHKDLEIDSGDSYFEYIFYNVETAEQAIIFSHDDDNEEITKVFQANPSTCSLITDVDSISMARQVTFNEQYGMYNVVVYKDDGSVVVWISVYNSDNSGNLLYSYKIGTWDVDENCDSYDKTTCLSCADGYEMTDSGLCSNGESDDADSKDSGSSLLSFSLLLLFAVVIMV